ncbi:hypothetical protein ACL02T_08515 [Pseudonocardia sp. RS010]|uniref:hypothetical protein n=1 Tax=Pseudonocardia sp. RS010 TaxID=3385979 RepID=UPI0039A1E018
MSEYNLIRETAVQEDLTTLRIELARIAGERFVANPTLAKPYAELLADRLTADFGDFHVLDREGV